MKITARKASALAIALAIPASSIAVTPFASAQEAGKEVAVNVNLGKDAADADVTLKAGGKTVGTKTASSSGKVSFSYKSKGAETLEVEVDGESITLSDAKCEAVKESTGVTTAGATNAGGDTTSAGNNTQAPAVVPPSNDGAAATPGAKPPAPGDDGEKKPGETTDPGADGEKKPGETTDPNGQSGDKKEDATGGNNTDKKEGEGQSGETNTPATNENTDGSKSKVETQAAIDEALIVLDEVQKEDLDVEISVDDAKEISNDAKALAKEGEKADGVVDVDLANKLVEDLDKSIKAAEQNGEDKVVLDAETQGAITDMLKSIDIGGMVSSALGATPFASAAPFVGKLANGLKNKILGGIGGNSSGGGLFGRLKNRITGKGGDSGSSNSAGSSAGSSTGSSAGGATGAGVKAPGAAQAPAATPTKENVKLSADVDETSFTVDLEAGTVSVDCDVDVEAEKVEKTTSSTTPAPTTPSQAPTPVAPVAHPAVATPGPKVNTGGEVEGTSFFAKVKAALF